MLNGQKFDIVYMDEASFIEKINIRKCRVCKVWKEIHYKPGDSARYSTSCDEYVPLDNLEYLEYIHAKRM